MVATELRVGNLINHGDKTIVVEDICKVGVNAEIDSYGHCDQIYHVLWKDLNPIPLTEEWLIKFGFDAKEYKKGYTGIRCGSTDFVLTYPKIMGEWQTYFCWVFDNYKFVTIKYVHELQNLYFLLSHSEELTLKKDEKVPSV
jgi:hypothetical protein